MKAHVTLFNRVGLDSGDRDALVEVLGILVEVRVHHDLGFYGKKGFERESTRIGDFIPAGPLPLFPQGCPFIPTGPSFYSRRACAATPGGI
jgi:hypothetical protein